MLTVRNGVLAFLSLIVVITLFSTVYQVNETERAVVLINGKYSRTETPGLHFKIPYLESVNLISVETFTRRYPSLVAYTKDVQPATTASSVTFTVKPELVAELYKSFKTVEVASARTVDRVIKESIEIVIGQYDAVDSVAKKAEVVLKITEQLRTKVHPSIEIISVQLEDVDFSEAFERAVEQRMEAEVGVQTINQSHERELVQKKIAITKAEASAESERERAKAAADAVKYAADADAYAKREVGEAEAFAITARAKALADNRLLVDLTIAEGWDGKSPTTMFTSTANPVKLFK